jgi:hypothetical protein
MRFSSTLLFVALAALSACSKAPQLPDDLPLKDFALPRDTVLLKSEKIVVEEGATPSYGPPRTKWTIQFSTPAEWPEVGAQMTMVLNVKNGMLAVPQEAISGRNLDHMEFHNVDQLLMATLRGTGTNQRITIMKWC